MTPNPSLSPEQLDRIRACAAILLPGSSDSPSAGALPDFDELVQQAAVALGGIDGALGTAIDLLPPDPSWESLEAFAARDPSSFDQVSLLAVGAYFMSQSVLGSLGIPTGARRATRPGRNAQRAED